MYELQPSLPVKKAHVTLGLFRPAGIAEGHLPTAQQPGMLQTACLINVDPKSHPAAKSAHWANECMSLKLPP